MSPKTETIKFEGQEFLLYGFSNPMGHEDWHVAEDMGLEYLYYAHHGPDYWDDELCFVKTEDKALSEEWRKSSWW